MLINTWNCRLFDPLIHGDYPPLMRKYVGNDLPKFSKQEKKLLKGSVDFLGVNHYTTFYAIDCFNSDECTLMDNRPNRGFVARAIARDGIPMGDQVIHYSALKS